MREDFPKADVKTLSRVHAADYIRFIHELDKQVNIDGRTVPFTPKVQKHVRHDDETKDQDDCDTSFSKGSLSAARRAVGAVCFAVDRVLAGMNRNAFCCVRPPGHHAGLKGLIQGATSCGFCIFNNVAAGALHALEEHKLMRVAIVDLDVHHGNGTQEIVMEHASPDRIFFFSVHLYDHTPTPAPSGRRSDSSSSSSSASQYEFYPGTGSRDRMEHNIVNAPLLPLWRRERGNNSANAQLGGDRKNGAKRRRTTRHYRRAGRTSFRATISERLIPALRAFSPQLILLSSGFDGAHGDVGNNLKSSGRNNGTSGIDLTPADFYWATQQIQEVASICCEGRIVSVLEGGYGRQQKRQNRLALDRKNFAKCVLSQIAALVDHRLPAERISHDMRGDDMSDDDSSVMQNTRAGVGASDSEVDSDDGSGSYRVTDEKERPPPAVEVEVEVEVK